jgi:competence protein ComEC
MADLAVAGPGRAAQWAGRLRAGLADRLAAEGERRVLWLPVFFGVGVGLYFALRIEPVRWSGAMAAAGTVLLVLALGRRRFWREAAIVLAVAAAGFAWMQAASWRDGGPMLRRRLGPVALTGRVVDLDLLEHGWRVIVAPDRIPRLPPDAAPRRVRLHIPPTSDALLPGDRVMLRAMLYPVPAPILPGGRDLQRELYFAGIGAVGYSFGPARRVAAAASLRGWREALRHLRGEMTRRIAAALPGSTGGVASALITGKRGTIAEPVKQAFRDAGLSHLLAIAGLHLGLVGGFVFFVVRGGLALLPPLALRWPIKKIAAAVTLVVLLCYLLISGAAIPTERAFVMNGLVFAAIMLDRLRLSMRVCAVAAAAVLLVEPSSLVGASFQMSFGAVVALIAVYETWGSRLWSLLFGGGLAGRAFGYCGAVALTTVVATLGTLPFSIYHFHRFALYSPLANVLAVPLSAVWTLPWGVIACLLMPFGLERLALMPMGWGIDLTIRVAQAVAAIPGDVWAMPRLPMPGLLLIAAGGLWLCLWRGAWRWWGIAAVMAGFCGMALTRPPDLVVADGARFIAARAPDGNYRVLADADEKIPRAFLEEETGATSSDWPAAGCSAGLCRYMARGRRVAIVTGAEGLPDNCAPFDALIAQVPAGTRCRWRMPVIDRIDSWERGAVALWLGTDGVTVESVDEARGDRPWVPRRRRRL